MVFSQISRATAFVVGAPQKGKRGQTFAPFNTDEKLLQLTSFSKPLLVPFEAGVYQETGQETRINLDAVIEGELLEIFDALDASFESQSGLGTGDREVRLFLLFISLLVLGLDVIETRLPHFKHGGTRRVLHELTERTF